MGFKKYIRPLYVCGLVGIAIAISGVVSFAYSAEPPSKQRTYPGGEDESPLEVQEEVPSPYSNVNIKAVQQKVRERLAKEEKKAE